MPMNRERWILLGASLVLVLAVYVFLAYLPLAKNLQRHRRVLAVKTQEWEAAKSLVAQVEAYQDRAARTRMTVERLEERLPLQPRVPELIKDVTRVATECNLKELQFTPQPRLKRQDYWEQPVKISAACSYHALGQFVTQLARLPRLVTARDLRITGRDKTGKSESVYAELTLVTYVQSTR